MFYSHGKWPINSCETKCRQAKHDTQLMVVYKCEPRVSVFPSFLSFTKIMQSTEYSEIWLNLTVAALSLIFIRGHKTFPASSNYWVTLQSRSTFQNLESTMWMAKLGKGMLFSVEQAFVVRDEIRAPLNTTAWEANLPSTGCPSQMTLYCHLQAPSAWTLLRCSFGKWNRNKETNENLEAEKR